MNIIERNYLPKLDLRETQEAIQLIEKKLIEGLTNKIELTTVRQPIVSSTRVSISGDKESNSRQLNFDSSNDNVVYYIYNDYRYWLVKTLDDLEIKNNNGILMTANYINRDVEIKNTQSMEGWKVYIEYRYDSDSQEEAITKAEELNEKVFKILKDIQSEISRKYGELDGSQLPDVIDEKDLKKVASRKNLQNTLSDIASDEGTFLLRDIRNKSKEISVDNSFEFSLYSYKKEIKEAYRIYKIQDRSTMADIEPYISQSESLMEEFMFGKNILKGNTRTINIEIDIDALCLLILEKSHVLELQSGKSIDEIEKILSEGNIKHL